MNNNPLTEYFNKNDKRLIHKWLHYFDIYHNHFKEFRNKEITIVEIGVYHGGSLQMWKNYFGRKARIIGIDIEPKSKKFEEKNIEIFIGDQEDKDFLKKIKKKIGPIDILIDDGGHTMKQQINTFEALYDSVVDGGIYLIEDLHTSYWDEYGGGYRHTDTFIEYAKNIIDQMHAWHSHDPASFKVDKITKSVKGMHVYDSIIVFDKHDVKQPVHKMVGEPSF